jgi:hypothetical protein
VADPFEICRLSVEHAKAHIEEIDVLSRGFIESDPYAFVVEDDPLYPTHNLHFLRLTKPLPFRVSGLAGDALVNLRNALDHAGYFIAIASGKSGKNAHFPFGEDAIDLDAKRKHRSKDIPKEMFDFMAALKPYRGGNDALWTLNKLSGLKKHEPLLRAEPHISMIEFSYASGSRLSLNPMLNEMHHPLPNGDWPIGWQRKGAPQTQEKIELTVLVRFNDVGLALKKPAVELLRDFSRVVERVLSGVEAEARRLGIFK